MTVRNADGLAHLYAGHPPQIYRIAQLADALDSRFRIPGTGFQVGWDGILGLIPGVGDVAGAGLGGYLVLQGVRMGARKRILLKMGLNIGFDMLLGLIPIIGDFADFVNKAHAKNARLLLAEYDAGRLAALR